jgi:hypothetical protein
VNRFIYGLYRGLTKISTGLAMKAAVIEKQGGIENIVYRDFPDFVLGSNGYTKEDIRRGMIDMADGKIRCPEIRTFPLPQLGEAEKVMESRDFFGKIVMIP